MPARSQSCDPIRRLYTFSVRGRDLFPIDMLRYDSCWPKSESQDSVSIMVTHGPRASREERTVTLIGLREPTEARWKSFGWTVV